MRTVDVVRRASRNLKQAKGRTILTSLAIAVGAFTISLALAAGAGGRAYTDAMLHSSGDTYSLSVYPKPAADTAPTDGLPEYGVEQTVAQDAGILTQRDAKTIKAIEGVESATPMLDITTEYATRGEGYKKYVAPVAVKADRTAMKLAAGSLQDNMVPAGSLVMPEGFLKTFGFNTAEEALQQTITITVPQFTVDGSVTGEARDFHFTIVAVDRRGDTTLYYTEALRVSTEDSQRMYAYQRGPEAGGRYYGLVVLLQPGTDVARAQQIIKDEGYLVYSLEDTRAAMLQVINIAQWALVGFGALAIIASIFGIINTQYISVLERTQQIGLMRSLGMRSRDVGRLFRYEAAWVGFLGGAIGVIGAFIVSLANPLITNAFQLEAGTALLIVEPLTSVVLIGSLILVAIGSGYFPSRKAAKLDPIEALRTE